MHAEVPRRSLTETFPAPAETISAQATTLRQFFDELNGRDWPVNLLKRRLPTLIQHAAALAPQDRSGWLAALHQLWHRHGWAFGHEAQRGLLELAASWCAWPLARAVGQSLQAHASLDTADAQHLLDTARHLGDGATATALSLGLQFAHPNDRCHADQHVHLQDWLRWRHHMPVIDSHDSDGEALRLEPLAHHHYRDFAWQYHDATIAERCCLPVFQEEAHWHGWLNHIYAAADERIFAVLHPTRGFIGCVSLILHDHVGLFYYWIGPDFQGNGHGPRAVKLMLSMTQQNHGLRCCYAKVFDSNLPSRRALQKLNFDDLGIGAIPPDDGQCFYRWGDPRPRNHIVSELHWLLARISSDTRPAALLLPQAATLGSPSSGSRIAVHQCFHQDDQVGAQPVHDRFIGTAGESNVCNVSAELSAAVHQRKLAPRTRARKTAAPF